MYYFIFSLNNCGTTIMSQFLATQADAYLPRFGNWEGQMVPAVKATMRRRPWDKKSSFDWAFIRAEWDKLLAKSGKRIFVEASPPNVVRASEILRHFAGDCRAVFSIGSPYTFVASCVKNYGQAPASRRMVLSQARKWLRRAMLQRDNILAHPDIPRTTYETFCGSPASFASYFDTTVGPCINRYPGKGNTLVSEIVDMSVRNQAFLNADERAHLSTILSRHEELLQFFGYRTKSPLDFEADFVAQPELAERGLKDRRQWDSQHELLASGRP